METGPYSPIRRTGEALDYKASDITTAPRRLLWIGSGTQYRNVCSGVPILRSSKCVPKLITPWNRPDRSENYGQER